jgi:hypothetical protein
LEAHLELIGHALDKREEDLFFIEKVLIERTVGDAATAADFSNTCLAEATTTKDAGASAQQCFIRRCTALS